MGYPVPVARPAEAAALVSDLVEQALDLFLGAHRQPDHDLTPAPSPLSVRNTSHRTAEDLAAEVQALAPDVNLSTIYRNLEALNGLASSSTHTSDTAPPSTTLRPRGTVTSCVRSVGR